MTERVQLARALVERRGRNFTAVADWRPLLSYTHGNPLTLTVLVGQALHDGLTSAEQIETFVDKLKAGEVDFADEESEGRSKSLGASLSYGFDAGFTDAERSRLGLLHLFQGFVDVDALKLMGNSEANWHLPEIEKLTRESWIDLLDRTADVGLLTTHGNGYYSIHPALPWFFKSHFDKDFRDSQAPFRAFAEAMAELGNYYANQYLGGNQQVISVLAAEEENLLYTHHLARTNGWYDAVISAMQGLGKLYARAGRRAEWKRLVEEIVPDFVDPVTDGPLAGLEEEWSYVMEYRVHLAREARDWSESERLQRLSVDWHRRGAAPFLEQAVGDLDDDARNKVRSLAVSVEMLGSTQRERGETGCVKHYQEALDLYERIGDDRAAAVVAFNLGHTYKNIPALRDLDQAETWYRRSLEMRGETNSLGRARCLGQIGTVAYERFIEARAAEGPKDEILRFLNESTHLFRQALDLLPENAISERAISEGQLGNVYGDAGDLDRALHHLSESIRLEELQGDLFGAAQTRFNVAITLAVAGRFDDAREYAAAALRNYEAFGPQATAEIEQIREFLVKTERALERQQT